MNIQTRLSDILQAREVAYDVDALRIIANVAEGGMRDALSILDQVLAYGTDRVTVDNARQVTGSTTTTQLMTYVTSVSQGNTPQGLSVLHDILIAGKDPQRFVVDVLGLLRDVMLADVAPDLIKTAIALSDLQVLAQQLPTARIQAMMVVLDDIQKQLMQTMQSDIYLELLTVKLSMTATQTATVPVPPAVMTQTKQSLPETTPSKQAPTPAQSVVPEVAPQVPAIDPLPPIAESGVAEQDMAAKAPASETTQLWARTGQSAVFAVLQKAKREALSRVKATWRELISQFDVAQQAMLTIAEPVAASDEGLVLALDFPPLLAQALDDATLQTQLRAALAGQQLPTEMVLITQDNWQQDRADYVAQLKSGATTPLNLADIPRVSPTTTQAVTTDAPVQAQTLEPEIVTEAKKMFGEAIVQVVD